MTNRLTQADTIDQRITTTSNAPDFAAPYGKISRVQLLTLALCFVVVAADGFDVAAVAFVGPVLQKTWGLSQAELGPLFGAALVGLTVGGFLFGPLADRIGRKCVIAISLVLFGVGSLACGYAPSARSLLWLRFATGLGLGGAMPNAITLSAEFSPAQKRAMMVTLMFCGFTAGLAFGGVIASLLIPEFGWRGVFVFGGLFPICLTPIVCIWLPESLHFSADRPRSGPKAAGTLAAHLDDPGAPLRNDSTETKPTSATSRSAFATLFNRQYRLGTLLLWVAFFCTLWVYYQVASWLPTVIADAGSNASRVARRSPRRHAPIRRNGRSTDQCPLDGADESIRRTRRVLCGSCRIDRSGRFHVRRRRDTLFDDLHGGRGIVGRADRRERCRRQFLYESRARDRRELGARCRTSGVDRRRAERRSMTGALSLASCRLYRLCGSGCPRRTRHAGKRTPLSCANGLALNALIPTRTCHSNHRRRRENNRRDVSRRRLA